MIVRKGPGGEPRGDVLKEEVLRVTPTEIVLPTGRWEPVPSGKTVEFAEPNGVVLRTTRADGGESLILFRVRRDFDADPPGDIFWALDLGQKDTLPVRINLGMVEVGSNPQPPTGSVAGFEVNGAAERHAQLAVARGIKPLGEVGVDRLRVVDLGSGEATFVRAPKGDELRKFGQAIERVQTEKGTPPKGFAPAPRDNVESLKARTAEMNSGQSPKW